MTGATTTRREGLGSAAREMTVLGPRLVAYNLGFLALVWGVAIGAIALFWTHQRWYTFVLAFLVVSSRQQALVNCAHEAVHRKFLPSRRANDFVGTFLCASPVGSPFGAARARHLSHHRLLGDGDDPDRELYDGPGKRTRKGLARHFIGGLLGGYAGMVLMGPPAARSARSTGSAQRDLVSLVLTQIAIATAFTLLTAWWLYPALWLIPLATVTTLCHLIRSFVEHAVTDAEMVDHDNRLITIRSNLIERFLVSPYNMNYHAEHHLVPSVPACRLKQLQEKVATRDDTPPVLVRTSYGQAIRRYVSALPD